MGNYFGGVDIKKNKEDIKSTKPSIVVGTPGRIKQVRQHPGPHQAAAPQPL